MSSETIISPEGRLTTIQQLEASCVHALATVKGVLYTGMNEEEAAIIMQTARAAKGAPVSWYNIADMVLFGRMQDMTLDVRVHTS